MIFGSMSFCTNWGLFSYPKTPNLCIVLTHKKSFNFLLMEFIIFEHLLISWLALDLADYFSIYLPPIIFGHTNHLMLAAPARFNIILTLLCNILITTYLGWFFYEFEWFTYLLSQDDTIDCDCVHFWYFWLVLMTSVWLIL